MLRGVLLSVAFCCLSIVYFASSWVITVARTIIEQQEVTCVSKSAPTSNVNWKAFPIQRKALRFPINHIRFCGSCKVMQNIRFMFSVVWLNRAIPEGDLKPNTLI